MSGLSPATFDSFGELLKYLRRRAQLTQKELGIAVGYSDAQIARLENGMRQPDLVAVKTVFAEALDIQSEPDLVQLLIRLAFTARGEHPAEEINHELPQPRLTNPYRAVSLPAQLTRFIGRGREVAQIVHLLGEKRLLTLTGAGGVGKTRLALEVGAKLAATKHGLKSGDHVQPRESATDRPAFPDGVWLVELASLNDPALVPQTVVSVFNLPEQPSRTFLEVLVTFLTGKRLLLILDNCEHLIGACAELAEALLMSCPDMHLLATSREPLNVSGEVIWRVSSLTTPDPSTLPPLEQLRGYEAVELFVDHATASHPEFNLGPDNAGAVAQVCHRLGGIPLALEMAAAQVAVLSVGEIAAALDDRFTLLTSGKRSALPRHQTLRATLDWSYALLSETERLLLARLSVFTGGWTIAAAQAVCAGPLRFVAGKEAAVLSGASDVLPSLLSLVHKSLVVATVREGQAHYVLLETVRQYADEKLHELGEVETSRDRHLTYFLTLAEETMDLGGRHVDTWIRRIDLVFDNLRAAFAWASERDDNGEAALRLAGGMRSYWGYRGHLGEGMGWLNTALARGSAAPAAARARALLAQASQLRHQGELARTQSTAEESIALFRQTDDRLGLAWCLVFLANNTNKSHAQALGAAAHRVRDDAQAVKLLEQSIAASQAVEESWDINLCLIRLYDVDPRRALELCAQELARRRTIGNLDHIEAILLSYGILLLSQGEHAQARSLLEEALQWWQQPEATPRYWAFPVILLGLGFIELVLGHIEPAIIWLDQSRKLHHEIGAIAVSDVALLLIGSAKIARGDLAHAADDTCSCLQRFNKFGYLTGMVCSVVQIADLAQRRGEMHRAVKLLAAAGVYGQEYDVTLPWATRVISRWYQLAQHTITKPTLTAARAQLGDAEFETVFAAGEQMTLAQTISYALRGTDET